MPSLRLLALVLAPAALLAIASTASAQAVINSVPYTISVSGKYVLGGNLIGATANQNAIRINAPNVILDLNGFFVSGPGNTPSSTIAVIFVSDVGNVTIRNGTVANNAYGISFGGSGNARNYLVENVNFTNTYQFGLNFASNAPGSIARNNSISEIGGTTAGANFNVYGIRSNGGVRIENNTINEVTATGTGISYGIFAATGDFSIGNTISSCAVGINAGKYKDNLTSGCATAFQNGAAVGFNN